MQTKMGWGGLWGLSFLTQLKIQPLRQVLGSLEGIAGLLASGQDATVAQNALRDLVLFSGTLDGAFILDLWGQVVWGDPASQVPVGTDLSRVPEVQEALVQGQPRVSGAVFQALAPEPRVLVTVPIVDGGTIRGGAGGAVKPAQGSLANLIIPLRVGEK